MSLPTPRSQATLRVPLDNLDELAILDPWHRHSERDAQMTRLVVVIPIGPNCRPEFVADTIASVDHFSPARRLLLLDDSGRGTGNTVAASVDAEVLEVSSNGLAGGLFATLGVGFSAALRQPFDVLLRLDTDALVTGSSFATQAAETFQRTPTVATLGSYRLSYSGGNRSFGQVRKKLIREAYLGFGDRELAQQLRGLLRHARKNGYKLGESVMGGVALYSHASIAALEAEGLLADPVLSRSTLQEDHLFALCLAALGFTLMDFGTIGDSLPMGVKHRGLPAKPEELVRDGRSLVHSTKFFQDMDEVVIRDEFRKLRANG